jgi:hypothetical protein
MRNATLNAVPWEFDQPELEIPPAGVVHVQVDLVDTIPVEPLAAEDAVFTKVHQALNLFGQQSHIGGLNTEAGMPVRFSRWTGDRDRVETLQEALNHRRKGGGRNRQP